MKDFFQIEEQKYRVEVNMLAAEAFEARSGITLSEFETLCVSRSKKGQGIDTLYILIWLYVSIQAGEELEGRTFEMTFDQMKAHVRPGHLNIFAGVFTKQYFAPVLPEENHTKEVKKKRRSFLSRLFNK
ncbi:hypothetical protein K4L44_05830 [Halosquirtibacter laminarini]|uniref:Uncharacterized protein n=1 Tax=Halosquirtibacter laminarini TaxID=3374600 RepID=A0AC61NI29_9BACT|nr:hypothetical protein K4L44_05830 [Prolixibacteraceae bacterium]